MPNPYQQRPVVFGNKGVLIKVDASQVPDNQYQRLVNVTALQEGALVTRNGFQRVNSSPFIDSFNRTLSLIHTIGRLVGDALTPILNIFFMNLGATGVRYFGEGQNIYRVPDVLNPPLTAPQATLGQFGRRWSYLSYRKFSSGFPYGYFATPTLMLKDVISDNASGQLQPFFKWGVDRPVIPAAVALQPILLNTFTGNCNTELFTVIRTSGNSFDVGWPSGTAFNIGSAGTAIDHVQDPDHLTLQISVGYQTNVAWNVVAATNTGPHAALRSYDYCYTFRNPNTGAESNPSPIMSQVTGKHAPINAQNQAVMVTVATTQPAPQLPGAIGNTGFQDPQVFGIAPFAPPQNYVAIYRRGGSFADGFFRLIGYFDAASQSQWPTVVDNNSDTAIASAPIAQFDNDPPVTSSLPISFSAKLGGVVPAPPATTYLGGINSVPLTSVQPGIAHLSDILRPGTIFQVGSGPTQEFCVLWAITGDFQVQLYFQFGHNAGEPIITGSIANQPCNLAATAFNSLFLAGDQNNPNFLYKSKTGQPDAFPVFNLEDNSPGSIEVGTPSNPIMAITEWNGEIICLNKSNIFIVQVWGGIMQAPILTPAARGLFGHWAWCHVDNEIWYLSYDGIYSWAGNESVKRSEAIDPMFKGETVNGFTPISLSTSTATNVISDLDSIQFFYHRNEVIILYRDTGGHTIRLRYHTVYDRWSQEQFNFANGVVPITQYVEQDTGNLLLSTSEGFGGGQTAAFVNMDNTPVSPTVAATTDGWVNSSQADGYPIAWEVSLPWYTMGAPTLQKQFGDIILEYQSTTSTVMVQTFYDFSTVPDPTDQFTVVSNVGRSRFVMSLKSGSAQEAYAVTFKLTGTTTTPVTLYSLTFNFLILENIQRGRALDWDNLGWPYDKRLQQLTIEYDTQGQPVTLNLDVSKGISPAVETQTVQTFTLNSPVSTTATGPVRNQDNFPINDGTIAKAIRLRPTVPNTNFKIWQYNFDFSKHPPDKVLFTEWEDGGWVCDKVYREVVIDVDTNGCPAVVNVQVDGVTRATFQVRTTSIDRKRILTMPSDVIGKLHRLLNVPDPAGKFQLFDVKWNFIQEPCAVQSWDSYENSLGYDLFKFIKQITVEYACESSTTFRVFRDGNQQLLSTTLPRHPFRNTERFYLPAINNGFLNKSKIYRFQMAPCNTCAPLKIYMDGTRVEFMPLGGDQRQGYQSAPLAEPMPIPVA